MIALGLLFALVALIVCLAEIARLRSELTTAESLARSEHAYFQVLLEDAREDARIYARRLHDLRAERKTGAP